MKTPLLRSGIGTKLISSSHFVTPVKVSDLTGAVLHYKFLGSFRERVEVEANRREHWNGSMRVVQIRDQLDNAGRADWTYPGTESYRDSQQLIDLGLIQPGDFRNQ